MYLKSYLAECWSMRLLLIIGTLTDVKDEITYALKMKLRRFGPHRNHFLQFTGLFEFGIKQLAIYLRFQEIGSLNIVIYGNSNISFNEFRRLSPILLLVSLFSKCKCISFRKCLGFCLAVGETRSHIKFVQFAELNSITPLQIVKISVSNG